MTTWRQTTDWRARGPLPRQPGCTKWRCYFLVLVNHTNHQPRKKNAKWKSDCPLFGFGDVIYLHPGPSNGSMPQESIAWKFARPSILHTTLHVCRLINWWKLRLRKRMDFHTPGQHRWSQTRQIHRLRRAKRSQSQEKKTDSVKKQRADAGFHGNSPYYFLLWFLYQTRSADRNE